MRRPLTPQGLEPQLTEPESVVLPITPRGTNRSVAGVGKKAGTLALAVSRVKSPICIPEHKLGRSTRRTNGRINVCQRKPPVAPYGWSFLPSGYRQRSDSGLESSWTDVPAVDSSYARFGVNVQWFFENSVAGCLRADAQSSAAICFHG